jgi:hypothetical protein
MEEIKTIVFSGFSGPLEDFYEDTLTIHRNGEVYYCGTVLGTPIDWTLTSDSPGFQILFSTLAILIIQAKKEQENKNKQIGGYKIEYILSDGEKASYTFYGIMEENSHTDIRGALLDLIPTYEGVPFYLDHKEDTDLDSLNTKEDSMIM